MVNIARRLFGLEKPEPVEEIPEPVEEIPEPVEDKPKITDKTTKQTTFIIPNYLQEEE